ncbi:MAG TPA: hypothetical protein VL463_26435 [Kofleriaceae bacterium]|nr:hypothetical protein [Kofleriaceae bacterium]
MILELSTVLTVVGCRFGEHHAAPPVDGSVGSDTPADAAGAPDAQNVFHGMHAMIGDRPEWTGSCSTLSTYDQMQMHFANPAQQEDVDAGWEFETDADSVSDPSYGFDPSWPMTAPSERFSLRFAATIHLAAGDHCFQIDTGATGTDIISGKNECGQIWLDGAKTAEVGYQAASNGPATGCITMAADGDAQLDVVFWYFNVFEKAKLQIRTCSGTSCAPSDPLDLSSLAPR